MLPEIGPVVSKSVPVVKRPRALNGEKVPVVRRSSVTRKLCCAGFFVSSCSHFACNFRCGLRYARSRAKKEGPNLAQQQRRRKDKGLSTKRDSTTPPTSAYSAIRRNYTESSFSTSSAGSASGSEVYAQSGHQVLENITPSPSPPASNMNFVHYAPGGSDNRQPYSGPAGNNFYSVPSPLSNTHVLHPPQQQHPSSSQHLSANQLPPLGQLSSYAERLSPSHSSMSSTLPAASYERERERERDYRELPPTPIAAEPRIASRRSIMSHQ